MARATKTDAVETADFVHSGAKRTNNPPARIASEGRVPRVPKATYRYNPHLPPVLRFDSTGKADELETLIESAGKGPLTAAEQQRLRDALSVHQPWLEWTQKQEQHDRSGFKVDPVVLHIHERLSTRAIIGAAMREDAQRKLFADPEQKYADAVRFYKHDVDWANRIILGDALQVMSSLAQRERLAGKVQMIYIDPPYGIKFGSNFQSEVGQREVKDKDSDLSREAETVKAYRDTWTLGVHSYLTYLRARLTVSRDLLHASGSLFLQISDDNLHRVRALLDEVFGPENFVSTISVVKTAGQSDEGISNVADYLLWYARDATQVKQRSLYHQKAAGGEFAEEYRFVRFADEQERRLTPEDIERPETFSADKKVFRPQPLVSQGFRQNTSVPFAFRGKVYDTGKTLNWKTTLQGMERLAQASRLYPRDRSLSYVRYIDDFPVVPLNNVWADTGSAGRPGEKLYVVQTSPKIIQRCLLMTTDPGDLVVDPTCGSGTTASLAEQWGRRWITIDTSRVAVAIARQRLVTARFEHFRTKGTAPESGFVYKSVPHITLKSIAQNTNLDPIFAKHQAVLDAALDRANVALKSVAPDTRRRLADKLADKLRREGKRGATDADTRRWTLPTGTFEHWTVPFDTDADWPEALQNAVSAYRAAWRAKMDEVNACIERNADQEELVDQPEVVKGVVRVSGPFTVEGVRPEELSLGEEGLFDATPNETDAEVELRYAVPSHRFHPVPSHGRLPVIPVGQRGRPVSRGRTGKRSPIRTECRPR